MRVGQRRGSACVGRDVTLPFSPTRTVGGARLEFQGAWRAMGSGMAQPPHHRPPVHPVLYLKPANTWVRASDPVLLPPDVEEVEVGATLGISFERAASRVSAVAYTHLTLPTNREV